MWMLENFERHCGQHVQAIMVGDSPSDIEAGKRAGLHTIKVDNNFTLNNWVKQILAH